MCLEKYICHQDPLCESNIASRDRKNWVHCNVQHDVMSDNVSLVPCGYSTVVQILCVKE